MLWVAVTLLLTAELSDAGTAGASTADVVVVTAVVAAWPLWPWTMTTPAPIVAAAVAASVEVVRRRTRCAVEVGRAMTGESTLCLKSRFRSPGD